MVQSSLSSSVLALERELGTVLFTRSRRGAALTDSGTALEPEARRVVAGVDRARDAVADVLGLLRGSASVATVALPRGIDVVDLVGQLVRAHPGVSTQIHHDGARDVLAAVR